MGGLTDFVRSVHGINAVIVVLAWFWALGLLVLRLFRPVRLSPRGPLRVLVGAFIVQVLLGLSTFSLLKIQNFPAFHGQSGLGHMGGGVAAALLATTALWQYEQSGKPWLTVVWCAMSMLALAVFG